MTRICSYVSDVLGQAMNTLRQKYREIYDEKEAKAGVKKGRCKRRELVVEELFADTPWVQECHHVTGQHTLLLKVKVDNTSALEELIRKLRSIEGVTRTETSVVLSTHTEGLWLDLKEKQEATEPDRGHKGNEGAQVLKLKRGG